MSERDIYMNYHVESPEGSMFESYYVQSDKEVVEIYRGGDYGEMIDAVMEHANVNFCFRHVYTEDKEDMEQIEKFRKGKVD